MTENTPGSESELPEEITFTRQTDMAALQREYGLDALIDSLAEQKDDLGDELADRAFHYLDQAFLLGKQYSRAILGDDPSTWTESPPPTE